MALSPVTREISFGWFCPFVLSIILVGRIAYRQQQLTGFSIGFPDDEQCFWPLKSRICISFSYQINVVKSCVPEAFLGGSRTIAKGLSATNCVCIASCPSDKPAGRNVGPDNGQGGCGWSFGMQYDLPLHLLELGGSVCVRSLCGKAPSTVRTTSLCISQRCGIPRRGSGAGIVAIGVSVAA